MFHDFFSWVREELCWPLKKPLWADDVGWHMVQLKASNLPWNPQSMCAKGANPPAQVVNISSLYNCPRPWSGFFTYRFWTTQRMCFSDNRCRPFSFLALFQVFIIFSIIFFIFLTENLGNSWILFFLIFGWKFDYFLFFSGWKNLPFFLYEKFEKKNPDCSSARIYKGLS
jgi:hypothetical protein